MLQRRALLRNIGVLIGIVILLLIVALAVQAIPGGVQSQPGSGPYPVGRGAYPPPRFTDDPDIYLTATAEELDLWAKNNPTREPGPTRIATPQVTPIPIAAAPVISTENCPDTGPGTIIYREGSALVALRPGGGSPERIIDIQETLGRFLAGDGVGVQESEWISLAPDGTRAALMLSSAPGPHVRGDPQIELDIYILDMSRGDLKLFAEGAELPAWSPDGSKIAFRQHGNLWVTDLETGRAKELYRADSENERYVDSFDWSPDSRALLFIDELFRQETILKTVDVGTAEVGLAVEHPLYFIYSPQWSPDGSQISYTTSDGISSSSDHFSNLWLVTPDGSDRRQVTQDINVITAPQWSPSGDWIAFAGPIGYERDQPRYDLWLVDPSGFNLIRLTATDDVNESSPAWSRDCSSIFVKVENSLLKKISLVDGNQSEIHPIEGEFVVSN